ncbi:MAG: M48 family metalloprotease [Candidatus Verstraetearchaeota archaeon]|nr:M48 family metalloprotease [Candidatus Verstraetearchaeota archaeon]
MSEIWKRSITFDINIPYESLPELLDYIIDNLEKSSNVIYISKYLSRDIAFIQFRLIANGNPIDIQIRFYKDKVDILYSPQLRDLTERDYKLIDLEIERLLRSFISEKESSSLFLVFSPKMELIPKSKEVGIKKIISSIVFGNFLYLFMIILLFGILLYQVFEMLTPIILVLIQFIILIFANNLILYRGEFEISKDNPSIHIAELKMKREELNNILRKCLPRIKEIKKEIYDNTLALGKELDPEIIRSILRKYEELCIPESIRIKVINVYKIIENLASKFKFPKLPRITLLNILPPNAAATGISPRRSAVLITSGLIISMNEEEIEAVIAHEFSHIKARDPLILMSLATFEYLTRVYIIWPKIASLGLFFDILYLFFSFTILFFIAKFLEARADLDAAIITNKPKALASALRKIGLFKYQSHIFEIVNTEEWLKWDPHPPLYYRIRVLENLEITKIKNTFISAINGCIKGFLDSLKGK